VRLKHPPSAIPHPTRINSIGHFDYPRIVNDTPILNRSKAWVSYPFYVFADDEKAQRVPFTQQFLILQELTPLAISIIHE